MDVDVVLMANDELPPGYLFAENVEADNLIGRKIVRESDGAFCLALMMPIRPIPARVPAERLDAAIASRAYRDFKLRVAMAAAQEPSAIPKLAEDNGLYAVEVIRWKNDFLSRFVQRE